MTECLVVKCINSRALVPDITHTAGFVENLAGRAVVVGIRKSEIGQIYPRRVEVVSSIKSCAQQANRHELCLHVNPGLNSSVNGISDNRRYLPQRDYDPRQVVCRPTLQARVTELYGANGRECLAKMGNQFTKKAIILFAYHGIGYKRYSQAVEIGQAGTGLVKRSRGPG